MLRQSACAVVVTYRPSITALNHLPHVIQQVQGLVVVDNGSDTHEVEALRAASLVLGFHLIENPENLGVAEALNQGVLWAKNQGYPWVILLDQDSGITDEFVAQMFRTLTTHSDCERIASIHPRYVDPKTGIELRIPRANDGSPIFPMTSGALMPVWIFDRIGWFASEYFVDLVDWEYSFRIRTAGFLIAESRAAKLLHSPGNPAEVNILGRPFPYSRHSPVRRYYISRNCVAFYRQYLSSFPEWVLRAMYRQFRDMVICLIADENRSSQFRNFLLGTWDGLTGRMGKRKDS
jgi:rhamnosyltransferase